MVSQKSMIVHGAGAASLATTSDAAISALSAGAGAAGSPRANPAAASAFRPTALAAGSALATAANKPAAGSPRGLGVPAGARAFANRATTTANTAPHRRMSVRDVALEEALGAADQAQHNNKLAGSASPNTISGSNPMAALSGANPMAALRRLSQNTVTMGAAAATAALSEQDISRLSTSEEFRKQLMVEREVHERMMVQVFIVALYTSYTTFYHDIGVVFVYYLIIMLLFGCCLLTSTPLVYSQYLSPLNYCMKQTLMLTNDLNERDDQIVTLKQQAAALQTALSQKEKMYEQDALVRMQLGKKLEQVLMDKEEVMEENELLQVMIS